MHPDVRSEMVPQSLVPALTHQIKVELAQRGPIPVGIVQDDHHPVGVGRFQAVVRDARTVHHPGEHPGGVHAAHLDPLPTGQNHHPGRVRAPPADHHALASIAIPFRVSTQDVVRIVMLPRDQSLQVRAVPRKVEMNR